MAMSLLQIVLSNAAAAAALALLVWAIGLAVKRPAVMRALWVIVLLKLLTPPVWMIPLSTPTRPAHNPSPAAPVVAQVEVRLTHDPLPPTAIETPTGIVAAPAPPVPRHREVSSSQIVRGLDDLWLAGSLLLVALTMLRLRSLRRLLKTAVLAPPDVQFQSARLAARIGIARPPGVWFVCGPVCPALWAFSLDPKILVPIGLWSQLDDRQRQTLLTHELAHLRRRDHWVRLMEAACVLLWWWHPVVWWARRRIHDYEEQCCDAWVLWAMPQAARSYGDTLLATIEFVSMYRPLRPALSAGLGEFGHLKRRLLMIRQGQVGRALSRTGLLAVGGAALAVLSVGPVWGQQAAASPPVAETTPPGISLPAPTLSSEAPAAPAASGVPQEQDEIAQARAQVDQLRAQLAQVQANLKMAMARLDVLQHGRSPAGVGSAMPEGGIAGPTGIVGRGAAVTVLPPQPQRPGVMAGTGSADVAVGQPGSPGSYSIRMLVMPSPSAGSTQKPDRRELRLEALERQLQTMMRELRELKHDEASADKAGNEAPGERTVPEPTRP